MDCISRRGLISAASVGVTGPLLIVDTADAGGEPALIRTSAVPVGGGVVIVQRRVVVTQPRAGRFRVFSAICTHQGCRVSHVEDRRIVCPCHSSRYRISDGAVVSGPAPRPLPRKSFEIRRGQIFLT